MISNPRSGRPLNAYNFGVEAIKELVGSQEDVRRFDLAILPASNQVKSSELNVLNSSRKTIEHRYTDIICKRAILWAWTRKLDQIRFDKGAELLCLKRASEICDKFSESLPLCDTGTMRYKIARLAISAAAMTFSTLDDSVEVILVRACHIDYVANFLIKEYSRPEFGYSDFSDAQIFSSKLLNEEEIIKTIQNTKHPKDLLTQLLHSEEISLADIQDWCEVDRDTAQGVMSLFVRKHALYRVKRWYVKTSEFIIMLKRVRDSGVLNKKHQGEF
jgi:hypothetical protein